MKYKSPTEVCITVDTEFSIAGAFRNPMKYQPVAEQVVECRIAGREHGLGFILEALGANATPATFFVETLNTTYFGDAPMSAIARRIATAGHDLQLHLHPCWTYFRQPDWPSRLRQEPPDDDTAGRSREEVADLVADGLATFSRWGLTRPIALRIGGLAVNRQVYDVMGDFGLPLASNIGVGIHSPAEPALRLTGGRHRIGRVLELPVMSYWTRIARGRRLRCLTIMATSIGEMESVLWQARAQQSSPVVILTHPFEFIKRRGLDYKTLGPNRVNQARLRALLAFLRHHPEDFAPVTVAGRAERWLAAVDSKAPDIHVPLTFEARRMVENKLNDLVWSY